MVQALDAVLGRVDGDLQDLFQVALAGVVGQALRAQAGLDHRVLDGGLGRDEALDRLGFGTFALHARHAGRAAGRRNNRHGWPPGELGRGPEMPGWCGKPPDAVLLL
ncbi:hypothetical protein D3C72_831140 [compost metagenome]